MLQFMLSNVDLQTADDGNTTYYGGSFTINNEHYNFHGNDRSNSPQQCIIEAMEDECQVDVFQEKVYDTLPDLIDMFLDEVYLKDKKQSFLIQIDQDKVVVDPIKD